MPIDHRGKGHNASYDWKVQALAYTELFPSITDIDRPSLYSDLHHESIVHENDESPTSTKCNINLMVPAFADSLNSPARRGARRYQWFFSRLILSGSEWKSQKIIRMAV